MKKKNNIYNRKAIKSWTLYDWANSVYALVISTAIFPIYFNSNSPDVIEVFGKQLKDETVLTATISISFIVISLLSPILSAIADIGGSKKSFMRFFSTLGSLACMGLFFFTKETFWFGLVLSFIASIGFSGSLVFYNAYLPEIAPPRLHDYISAKGFSMGYLGGAILLIIILALGMSHEQLGITEGLAYRVGFLLVGIWWLVFSLISFNGLPSSSSQHKIEKDVIKSSYKELGIVWKDLRKDKRLVNFLQAFLMYNTGVQTIILTAALFGSDVLGLATESLIITILLIQFIAMPGAHLFAKIATKKGNAISLMYASIIWAAICIGAYFIQTDIQFYAFGGLVGLV
ncbi:MAG: MFS transporter, partial [Flavobacteriales bacterium]